MRNRLLALVVLLGLGAPASALPKKLPPVDQCSADPGFSKFLANLRRTVAKKDKKALLAMLSPRVLVNFGGASGPSAFEQSWSFDANDNDGIWAQLERILPLGCARDGSARVIPSLAIQFDPEGDEEVFEAMVVVAKGAKLRSGPETDSPALAILSWDVVTAIDEASDLQTKVRLEDGREGYMFDDELYSPLNYRMVVEKLRGSWMITAFVAGD
ncbi:MAG TPA: SH3 domain-containing protein [Sphingomicrobium sp.]|nr:SH3 domain-containing protein [Sphingomicrobium sp.]